MNAKEDKLCNDWNSKNLPHREITEIFHYSEEEVETETSNAIFVENTNIFIIAMHAPGMFMLVFGTEQKDLEDPGKIDIDNTM